MLVLASNPTILSKAHVPNVEVGLINTQRDDFSNSLSRKKLKMNIFIKGKKKTFNVPSITFYQKKLKLTLNLCVALRIVRFLFLPMPPSFFQSNIEPIYLKLIFYNSSSLFFRWDNVFCNTAEIV